MKIVLRHKKAIPPKRRPKPAKLRKSRPRAGKRPRKRVSSKPSKTLVWLQPVVEGNGKVKWDVWNTKCGRYTVVRSQSGWSGRFGSGFNNKPIELYHETLHDAVKACEVSYCEQMKLKIEDFKSNREEIVQRHLEWLPPVQEDHDVAVWTVWRTRCGRFAVARSHPKLSGSEPRYVATVGKDRTLGSDYANLGAAIFDAEKIHCRETGQNSDSFMSNRVDVIAEAHKQNLFTIEEAESMPGPIVPGTIPAAVKKPAFDRKTTGPKDEFGFMEGSVGYKVNAVLTTKPQSMKEICGAAKLNGTCFNHLKKMTEDGHVKKEGKLFLLVKERIK